MKRKTTKLLSILLILIMTVSSITACGDKSDKKSGQIVQHHSLLADGN